MNAPEPGLSQAGSYYELPPTARNAREQASAAAVGITDSLPDPFLWENVTWLCRLRWLAVTLLALFGLATLLPAVCRALDLRPNALWPFVTAGLLALTNLGFIEHARQAGRAKVKDGGGVSLWAQIVVDLLILTAVVHYTGPWETGVYLAYLFHIVLACIFFSPCASFLVTILACLLFTGCVMTEVAGLLNPAGIFVEALGPARSGWPSALFFTNMISVQVIWVIVWYLASHLSAMVRTRDDELAQANRLLLEAQSERARHMLLTTHELKAPFAAIHSNAQLLLKGYCGVLPDKALEVAARIANRSRRLGWEIQDMLQLANLNAPSQAMPTPVNLDLVTTLKWCVDQVQARAEEHGITFEVEAPPGQLLACCVEDHLKMLFLNLLVNAVTYSHDGGLVLVRCRALGDGRAAVSVEDHGIGIPAAKLPRVFEEYYRTDEAVKHCRESTGLGLAIVRQVAQSWDIQVKVTSQSGHGTVFDLVFPRPASGFAEEA